MTPIGPHIEISKPEPVVKHSLIVEQEAVSKAQVLRISPDSVEPFKEGDYVYFYTGKEICLIGKYFIGVNMIVLWE